MSNGTLWSCVRCAGRTAKPRILRGRRGGWLTRTICKRCSAVNYHNKRGDWIGPLDWDANPEHLPYLDAHGELIIPMDCPKKYRWWQGGQSIELTIAEVKNG